MESIENMRGLLIDCMVLDLDSWFSEDLAWLTAALALRRGEFARSFVLHLCPSVPRSANRLQTHARRLLLVGLAAQVLKTVRNYGGLHWGAFVRSAHRFLVPLLFVNPGGGASLLGTGETENLGDHAEPHGPRTFRSICRFLAPCYSLWATSWPGVVGHSGRRGAHRACIGKRSWA